MGAAPITTGGSCRTRARREGGLERRGARGRGDELREEVAVAAPTDEALRVPLHADEEAVARLLEGLHGAVGGPGRGHEPVAHPRGGLVVEGVDVGPAAAEEPRQAAPGGDG